MLNLLVDYARDKGLVVEPGFTAKIIRWGVGLSQDGRFTGAILPLGENGKGIAVDRCPEFSFSAMKFLGRGGNYGAHFLVSECDAVALLTDAEAEPSDRARKRHASFTALMREAALEVPSLIPVVTALTDTDTVDSIRDALAQTKAKATDKATFLVTGRMLVSESDWHVWWRSYLQHLEERMRGSGAGGGRAESGGAAQSMVCLATGAVAPPARLHPKITGLGDVGGQPQVPFIGFDKEAFTSYGLLQSANAAVTEEAAFAYRAALDYLLRKDNSVRFAGMRVAHWYDREVPTEDDPLSYLYEEQDIRVNEESALLRARKLLERVTSGGAAADMGQARFFALSLSGAGGRAMVRDWMTGQFADLAESVGQWFEDLQIVKVDGAYLARAPAFKSVLTCPLDPKGPNQNEDDWIKPVKGLQAPLWRAALDKDAPVPFAAVSLLLGSHRDFVLAGKMEDVLPRHNGEPTASRTDPAALALVYRRMGLIRAYHNRKERKKPGGYLMKPTVNEDHPEAAYHCGRLMAMLAAVQRQALGDVGAGVVQRYYGAASATPALVLGRLTRLSQHHLAKIVREAPEEAYRQECRIAEIWSRLGNALPPTLNLEQQSLFALGYYQQMASHRTPKSGDPGAIPE